jgi:hypothetical protein
MKRSEAKGFGLQPRGALIQQGNISKDDRDWETTENIEFGRIWLDCLRLRKENYFCLISDGRLRSNHGSSSS